MSLTLGRISEYDVKDFDIFNHQNTRTEEDIKKSTGCYNCMSYAFNAFEWINPINFFCENAVWFSFERIAFLTFLSFTVNDATDDLLLFFPTYISYPSTESSFFH